MEAHQIVLRILKNLNCYSEYKKEFIKLPRYIGKNKDFKSFIKSIKKYRGESWFEYIINDSFDWNCTTQGFNYGNNIAVDP